MKSTSATSCLLAALLAGASYAHPDTPAILTPTPTSTGGRMDDLIPSATPFPGLSPHLQLRQNLGVDQDPGANPGQVPPVTVYSIVSQVGATGAVEIYTYTQRFVTPLGQLPAAQPGAIGYGTLQQKRQVPAQPTPSINTGYIMQPLVIAMETLLITRPLRRVTEIVIVETFFETVTATNATVNGTMPYAANGTAPYMANGTMPYGRNDTFPTNGTAHTLNGTYPANGTASVVNGTLSTLLASAGTGYGRYNATMMGSRHST